jgi:tRNA A37 methylthiotransferase MiaB
MRQKVYFKTFGCRTNLFDSQVMMQNLEDFDITEDENQADVIVVNSCTVTNGADTTVRSYVNHIEKTTGVKLFLTGCGAHTKGENLFEKKKVFGVFGQSEKQKINTLLKENTPFYELGDLNFVDDAVVSEFIGKSRAFIKRGVTFAVTTASSHLYAVMREVWMRIEYLNKYNDSHQTALESLS